MAVFPSMFTTPPLIESIQDNDAPIVRFENVDDLFDDIYDTDEDFLIVMSMVLPSYSCLGFLPGRTLY